VISLGLEPSAEECSRAGCRGQATHRIEWRNPRIHTADRRKVWLACDEHEEYLREFLAARDFPLRVVALHDDGSAAAPLGEVSPA
jgi:hypothetical protein